MNRWSLTTHLLSFTWSVRFFLNWLSLQNKQTKLAFCNILDFTTPVQNIDVLFQNSPCLCNTVYWSYCMFQKTSITSFREYWHIKCPTSFLPFNNSIHGLLTSKRTKMHHKSSLYDYNNIWIWIQFITI